MSTIVQKKMCSSYSVSLFFDEKVIAIVSDGAVKNLNTNWSILMLKYFYTVQGYN